MTTPVKKVEVGFDLTSSGGPFLILDDPVSGRLDDPDWVLAGTFYYDVTDRVRSYSIGRGKSRELDRYQTGTSSVVFDNRDRAFDPVFEDSPFYGNIIPRRDMRITVNDRVQYSGVIDDWNLNYDISTDSTTVGAATDGFAVLAKQTLTGGTATPQTSGERVAAILDRAEVNWPAARRDIDLGDAAIGADVIADDTNVLQYLQLIETAEQGSLFINKHGDLAFKARSYLPASSGGVTLADDGSGIPYQSMQVVYGSELLYNEVVVSSSVTAATAIAVDEDSQTAYGVANLTLSDLPLATDQELVDTAVFLASKYSTPEYRFEQIEVLLDDLTESEQNQILDLEIGDVVRIKFTPNNIPPAISKVAQVISISHQAGIDRYSITFGFQTLDFAPMILDDVEFGKLDSGNALSY